MGTMEVTLQTFCKSNKILGVPIKESYEHFKAIYNSSISQYQFEKGLEAMNKEVIKHLKKKCFEFLKNECPNSYDAFIERHEFITKEFWRDIKAQQATPDVNTHKSKMPINWDVMPFSERVEFTKSLKDSEFKAYVMARDPKIKKSLNSQFQSKMDLADVALSYASPKVAEIPELQREMLGQEPQHEIPQEVPKNHKEKMPIDWINMGFSDRLDFARAISDEDFKSYVLAQDPKIKEYLDRLENKKPREETFKLYVTLYSFPVKEAPPKARVLVKGLIEALNKLGRGRLQYVELLDPHIIEIREVK